eukprot:TRINITY_DN2463_c0_g1_i1.p1 TRINITY_DN2463_c0_g1~~TRINITY_DN2463_c0_g1_i1.p1  ORF type:complete len:765 (-),score=220.89 TRINITY_DN2463_c0_g1_i1:77-2197(-)
MKKSDNKLLSMQGELFLMMNKNWKRRFFILKETTLFYYKNEKVYNEDKRKVPDGLIKLSMSTPVAGKKKLIEKIILIFLMSVRFKKETTKKLHKSGLENVTLLTRTNSQSVLISKEMKKSDNKLLSMQGELFLMMNKNWKRRFFILKETTLFYYKNEKVYNEDKRKVPDGLIKLSMSTPVAETQVGSLLEFMTEEQGKIVTKEICMKQPFGILITTLIGNKKMPPCYLIACNNVKERSDWLKAIHFNINSSEQNALSFLEFSNKLSKGNNTNHNENHNETEDKNKKNGKDFNSSEDYTSSKEFSSPPQQKSTHSRSSESQIQSSNSSLSSSLHSPNLMYTTGENKNKYSHKKDKNHKRSNHNSNEYTLTKMKSENIETDIRYLLKEKMVDLNLFGKEVGEQVIQRFPWEINFKEIKIIDKIGEGGFGEVLKCTWRNTEVAVKQLTNKDIQKEDLESFVREIYLLSQLRHPNILLFLGASIDYPSIFYITEYVPKGNLRQILETESLLWRTKVSLAMDTARGMNYLHKINPPILHRDLKSLNLLVDDKYSIRVADFGLGKLKDVQQKANTRMGTVNWVAPEILRETDPYTEKADVFSFGIVLWEILTEKIPYGEMQVLQIVRAIDTGKRPPIPEDCDVEYKNLIEICWHDDHHTRPYFDTIYENLTSIHHNLVNKIEKNEEVKQTVKDWFFGGQDDKNTTDHDKNDK